MGALYKLNDRQIRAAGPRLKAEPKDEGDFVSEYLLSDGGNLHLMVRRKPDGGFLKGFCFIYKLKGCNRARLWLGTYPDLTLADARALAGQYRNLCARGIDPRQAKKEEEQKRIDNAAKQQATFGKVADDWLEHVHQHGGKNGKWGEGHTARVKGQLRNYILPKLRKQPIHVIKPAEVASVIKAVADKGHKEVAGRVRWVIGEVFEYACNVGLIDSTQHIVRNNAKIGGQYNVQQQHRPAITDPHIFAELLRDIDAYTSRGPVVRAFMQLAPLLVQRSQEMRAMRWAHLDFAKGLWRSPSESRKLGQDKKGVFPDFMVPLPKQAIAILRELEEYTGGEGYVFVGQKRGRSISADTPNNALRTMGWPTTPRLEGERMRAHCLHGFRASFLTLAQEAFGSGVRTSADYQLGHLPKMNESASNLGMAYNRTTLLEERQELMQRWADWLDTLKANGSGSRN